MTAAKFDLVGQYAIQLGGDYLLSLELFNSSNVAQDFVGPIEFKLYNSPSGRGTPILEAELTLVDNTAELTITEATVNALTLRRCSYSIAQDAVPLLGGYCDVIPLATGAPQSTAPLRIIQNTNVIRISATNLLQGSGFSPSIVTASATITGDYFDFGEGNLVPIYRVPVTPDNDDWIPGVEMYEDLLATTLVTTNTQVVRAWKSPTGRLLLATESAGMKVQTIDGVLTPYESPAGGTGGFYLDGGVNEPMDVHLQVRVAAGKSLGFYLGDTPDRNCEFGQYGSLLPYVYNGSNVQSSGVPVLANKTLLSFSYAGTQLTAYRNGTQIATVGGSSYQFPLPLQIGKSGAGVSQCAKFYDRIRISPAGNITSDMVELVALLPTLPATKIVVISDSQFTLVVDSREGGGLNNRLAEIFQVLPCSEPGGTFSSVTSNQASTIIAFGASRAIFCLTNDFASGRTAAQLFSDITTFASTISQSNPLVVLPWARGSNWGVLTQSGYTQVCVDFAALCNASGSGVTPINGLGLIVGANLGTDGVHLPPPGREAILTALLAELS